MPIESYKKEFADTIEEKVREFEEKNIDEKGIYTDNPTCIGAITRKENIEWLRSALIATHNAALDEAVRVNHKMITDTPEVETDFNDGGDSDYAERRIAIESHSRGSRINALHQSTSAIEKLKSNP